MNVDWDVFERLEVFVRGDVKTRRGKRSAIFFWREGGKEVETYQRVVLLLKLRKHKRLPPTIDTEGVFLKMFKDIPKVDLEMVLPGTSLQMPWMQKSKLSVSLIGTLGYGLSKVAMKIMEGVQALVSGGVQAATSAGEL